MMLDIIVEPDGGAYHAFCPMLPGLHVAGGTEKEALRNVGDALSAYMESMIKHGDPLPHSRSEARRFRVQYEGRPPEDRGDPHRACPTDAVCGQYGDAPCRAAKL